MSFETNKIQIIQAVHCYGILSVYYCIYTFSIPTSTGIVKSIELVTRISNMGEKKIIIIPKSYHELLKKRNLLDKEISVTLEQIS